VLSQGIQVLELQDLPGFVDKDSAGQDKRLVLQALEQVESHILLNHGK
jgi:hypothetical protein